MNWPITKSTNCTSAGGRLREKYKRWSFKAAEKYVTTAKSARANTRESSSSRWLTKKDLTRDRRCETAERENRVNLGKERCSRVTKGVAGLLKV